MDCCPYCGASLDPAAGFCTRCGEPDRTDVETDAGWLHPVSRQFCEGVAHGSRRADPDDPAAEQCRDDITAALADLAALQGVETTASTVSPVDPETALAAARDAEELDALPPAVQGLLVGIEMLADIDSATADDLLAQARRLSE